MYGRGPSWTCDVHRIFAQEIAMKVTGQMESFRTWRDATGDDWCMVQISSENEGYGEVVPRMTNSVGFCAMDSTPCLNMFEP